MKNQCILSFIIFCTVSYSYSFMRKWRYTNLNMAFEKTNSFIMTLNSNNSNIIILRQNHHNHYNYHPHKQKTIKSPSLPHNQTTTKPPTSPNLSHKPPPQNISSPTNATQTTLTSTESSHRLFSLIRAVINFPALLKRVCVRTMLRVSDSLSSTL